MIKNEDFYELSESSENIIPYLSNKMSPLPIVLIDICKGRKHFLYKREKRPFKGLLSLPGGRILVGESLKDSVKRIMKENCDCTEGEK